MSESSLARHPFFIVTKGAIVEDAGSICKVFVKRLLCTVS